MRLVSALGLLAILAVAWLLSSSRREVRARTVLWGLGLQFLLALVILRDDLWGSVGIVAFAVLLVLYGARKVGAVSWAQSAIWVAVAALLTALLARVEPDVLLGLLVTLGVALAIDSRWRLAPAARPVLGTGAIVLSVSWIFAAGLSGRDLFSRLSLGAAEFLNLADYGARFLFGNLALDRFYFPPDGGEWPGFGYLFAFKLLPIIVFFGAVMAVLYYLGWVQAVIEAVARFMRWTMGTGGAETLCAATNIFIGQTEAPLLIKPYLATMTRSELASVMVGGFATIAGGSLAAYIAMGAPPEHLLAAAVMSAPAALVIAKILAPQRLGSRGAEVDRLESVEAGDNLIEAATIGITDGWKLAVNVGAMLVGFISLIAVVDVGLNWVDAMVDGGLLGGAVIERSGSGISPVVREFAGVVPGSLQTLFGVALAPVAWLLGVPWGDATRVGHLLGITVSLNEFVAYGSLAASIQNGELGERATILATYALCGFANFGSIGIQIGGLSSLAPGRRADFARIGLKAMIGGTLASWLTATVAGILLP